MLAVPVFSMQGERVGEMEIDPAVLGGRVRARLLKQAVVAHQDHQRRQNARTKRRSDVEGSTRKLFRQKGTGNARAGTLRTPIRRGGGRAFAKRVPGASKGIPKKMRRLARCNALLAKLRSDDVLVVDDVRCPEPRTKVIASMLSALGADGGCLLAMHEPDRNVYLSGRNIPNTAIRVVDELNAYEVLLPKKVIFTREAFGRVARGSWSRYEPGSGE